MSDFCSGQKSNCVQQNISLDGGLLCEKFLFVTLICFTVFF